MKTAISIPDPVFQAAEKVAKRLAISRSELYAKAVEVFVASHQADGITRQLDDVYCMEEATIDPALVAMQSLSIGDETW